MRLLIAGMMLTLKQSGYLKMNYRVSTVLVRLRTEKFIETDIEVGREIIKASNGLITWMDAEG